MSEGAASALRTSLEKITADTFKITAAGPEAAKALQDNFTRVVQDITNPGPKNIDGKDLTQKLLKRVDMEHQTTVEAMIKEVCARLQGKAGTAAPSHPGEAKVWAAAATYLSKRVQGTNDEKRGRNPDMSPEAAMALRMVLGEVAFHSEKVSNISFSNWGSSSFILKSV